MLMTIIMNIEKVLDRGNLEVSERKSFNCNQISNITYCLCFEDVRSLVCLAWLVCTTVYGISLSCSSVIPVVSTRENSRCCFNSLGSHFFSLGERDLDLMKNCEFIHNFLYAIHCVCIKKFS